MKNKMKNKKALQGAIPRSALILWLAVTNSHLME